MEKKNWNYGKDYVVKSFSENKNSGIGYAQIKGIGEYCDSRKVNFEIVKVTKVELDKSTISINKGASSTIKVINPNNIDNQLIDWKTSNSNIVIVDENGKITAKNEGTAKITATVGTKKAECTINVTAPIRNMVLSKTKITLIPKQKTKLLAKVESSNIDADKISWTSKNKNIATVDKKGNITAINLGKTTIKATLEGITRACEVEVAIPTTQNFKYDEASLTQNSVRLVWDKNEYADTYKVYINTEDKDGCYQKIIETKNLYYEVKDLNPNTTYYFKLTACKKGVSHQLAARIENGNVGENKTGIRTKANL